MCGVGTMESHKSGLIAQAESHREPPHPWVYQSYSLHALAACITKSTAECKEEMENPFWNIWGGGRVD